MDKDKDLKLDFDHLSQWTDWLMAHHITDQCVWLRIKKKGSLKPGIYLNEAVIEALRFGWIDGRVNTIDQDYFYIRCTVRKPNSVWSLINRNRAETLIKEGKMMPLGLKSIESAQQAGTWQAAYTSLSNTETPTDLKAALEANLQAQATYDLWSNSDKLQAMYWINTSKTKEIRLKRIQHVITVAQNKLKFSQKNNTSL